MHYHETLCWTCKRGYSRPDPEGCIYHRMLAEDRRSAEFDWHKRHVKRINRSAAEGCGEVYIIVDCDRYVPSDREVLSRAPRDQFRAELKMRPGDKRRCSHCGKIFINDKNKTVFRRYCHPECGRGTTHGRRGRATDDVLLD